MLSDYNTKLKRLEVLIGLEAQMNLSIFIFENQIISFLMISKLSNFDNL